MQTVIVTDAAEFTRLLDMQTDWPLATLAALGALQPRGNPELVALSTWVREHAALWLLESSGAGKVLSLTRAIEFDRFPRYPDANAASRAVAPRQLYERVGGSLKQVTKLASQSTALVARRPTGQPDAEDQMLSEIDRWSFFPGDSPWHARRELRLIAQRRFVFDRGEENITGLVDEIQRVAAAASERPMGGTSRGYVRTGEDGNYLRMQIADVAAGWATGIARFDGLLGVVKRFDHVLYNGSRLLENAAARIDRERLRHAENLGSYVR